MYIYNFNKFYKIFVSYYHDTIQYTIKKKMDSCFDNLDNY